MFKETTRWQGLGLEPPTFRSEIQRANHYNTVFPQLLLHVLVRFCLITHMISDPTGPLSVLYISLIRWSYMILLWLPESTESKRLLNKVKKCRYFRNLKVNKLTRDPPLTLIFFVFVFDQGLPLHCMMKSRST